MAKGPMGQAVQSGGAGVWTALKFVVLLGVVSLFADMTYEGARSITGPYLTLLGASALATGAVAGLGELAGYGLRIASGYLAHRSRRYWAITILGYSVNLLAVPLLALAVNWQVAALLIVAERLGKAIRTPARDTMLSHATVEMGRGWGFGLHEAMDQVGAVLGPLIVAGVLHFRGDYQEGFAVLLVPALLAMAALALGRWLYPDTHRWEEAKVRRPLAKGKGFSGRFWLYMVFVGLSIAGFGHFQLISYHMKAASVVSDAQVPLLFAIAMAVDALAALLTGRMFDRVGLRALVAVPLLSLAVAPLAFSGSYGMVVAGMVLWGAVLGVQETIMRAAVADLAPSDIRALAYGFFNTTYGLFWFTGSLLLGLLYDVRVGYLVALSVALEVLSFLPLFIIISRWRREDVKLSKR